MSNFIFIHAYLGCMAALATWLLLKVAMKNLAVFTLWLLELIHCHTEKLGYNQYGDFCYWTMQTGAPPMYHRLLLPKRTLIPKVTVDKLKQLSV